MSREAHVRFCERRGVRLPPATHLIVHCTSQAQAEQVRDAIAARLAECSLELHPDKTRIVYCKQSGRHGSHEHESFDFLGYTFRPSQGHEQDGAGVRLVLTRGEQSRGQGHAAGDQIVAAAPQDYPVLG
jgi:RNA-directed DNA polymerase